MKPSMMRRLRNRLQMARFLLCAVSCLLIFAYPAFAQYNTSFDSAYRVALSLPDPASRLAHLRPLINQSYESSVFQTIAFGKALLTAASEANSSKDIYQGHIVLCTGYERNREFGQSISHGLEAARIAERERDYPKQVNAFQAIAFSYSSLGLMSADQADFAKALYYCDQAIRVIKLAHLEEEAHRIITTRADVYGMLKKYDTAINLYRSAIAALHQQGKDGGMDLYMNFGIALNLNGNYQEALWAYQKADSICDAQQAGAFYKLKIASNVAELYSDMGQPQESERMTHDVLARAQQSGAVDVAVDMVLLLKNICWKQGRYKEAVVYADTLAAIKERMLNTEKTGQLAEMQARYDAGVKDQQIAGQAATIRQKHQQNVLLWTAVALLFLAGTIAYIGMRRSRQLNTKITAQQQQLIHQKTELQRINEMKDQLFSLIGHDLRTPLNSLTAYATLLDQNEALPPEKAKQYSADLRITLGHTAALMENLLHFAKTQMKATRAYPELHALSDIADGAAGLLQPAMTQKNIRLTTRFSADTTAYCDEDMTELILRNLLGNAIKFSTAGGTILFTIAPYDDTFIACTVRDYGAGLKPELAALWNGAEVPAPVRSAEGTQREKGAGLGLMLSKTFAAMMGGRLSVSSEEGKGAAFCLLLPRNKAIAADSTVAV